MKKAEGSEDTRPGLSPASAEVLPGNQCLEDGVGFVNTRREPPEAPGPSGARLSPGRWRRQVPVQYQADGPSPASSPVPLAHLAGSLGWHYACVALTRGSTCGGVCGGMGQGTRHGGALRKRLEFLEIITEKGGMCQEVPDVWVSVLLTGESETPQLSRRL